MSLLLARPDLTRLEAVQEALLSPLDHETADEWCEAVLDEVEKLFRADRSMVVLPRDGEVLICGDRLEPSILAAFGDMRVKQGSGALCYTSQGLDQTTERRRTEGLEGGSCAVLEGVSGISMPGTDVRHEVVRLARDCCGFGMNVSLPVGEATLYLAYSRPECDPFGKESGLQLLRLLLPAFRMGVRTISSLRRHRASLSSVLDTVADAVALWDVDGKELHRSRAFRQLFANNPDADRIMDEVRFLVGRLSVVRRPPTEADSWEPPSVDEREVSTAAARYQLRAEYLAAGLFGRDPTVAVAVERLTPELPPAEDLQERFGLTPREGEVARLLARGLSNKEAAEQLFISPHTVRSHAERIFRKLGIHTRKALGLKLLEGDC